MIGKTSPESKCVSEDYTKWISEACSKQHYDNAIWKKGKYASSLQLESCIIVSLCLLYVSICRLYMTRANWFLVQNNSVLFSLFCDYTLIKDQMLNWFVFSSLLAFIVFIESASLVNLIFSQLESVFLPGRLAVSRGADVLSKVACLCWKLLFPGALYSSQSLWWEET